MAYSFSDYYKIGKNLLEKIVISAIERGKKYKSSEYAEAVDFN